MGIDDHVQLLGKLDFYGNSLLQVSFIVVVVNAFESMLSTKLFFSIISFKNYVSRLKGLARWMVSQMRMI